MESKVPQVRSEWLTYKEAQQLTGLGRTTLWQLAAKEGLIPVSRQGRTVRLHRKSLDELMWRRVRSAEAGTPPGKDTPLPEDQRPSLIVEDD